MNGPPESPWQEPLPLSKAHRSKAACGSHFTGNLSSSFISSYFLIQPQIFKRFYEEKPTSKVSKRHNKRDPDEIAGKF